MKTIWIPFYLIYILFWPFIKLLEEVEKFGKYLHWGRIDLEEAYRLGMENSRADIERYFNVQLNYIKEKFIEANENLLKELKIKVKVSKETPFARDYDTGKPSLFFKRLELPTLGIRILFDPENRFIMVPSKKEIQDMIDIPPTGGDT